MQLRTLLCLGVVRVAFASDLRAQQLNVRLVTDEAEAVFAILAKKTANETITPDHRYIRTRSASRKNRARWDNEAAAAHNRGAKSRWRRGRSQ